MFEDQIYNPLDPQTDQFGYLEVNQAKGVIEVSNEQIIEHTVLLDSIMSEKDACDTVSGMRWQTLVAFMTVLFF